MARKLRTRGAWSGADDSWPAPSSGRRRSLQCGLQHRPGDGSRHRPPGLLAGPLLALADLLALAELPSRDELLAMMLRTMSAPATNFVGVLAAVPRTFVQALSAIKDQKDAA